MADAFVALLMGSDSDLPVLEGTLDVLAGYGVRVETRVLSAHRTPEQTREFVADAEQRGCKVFICAAGLAAGVDPRGLMIPAAVSASCAFMMPVATAPNAVVFGTERVPIGAMVRNGLWLNLLGALVITLVTVALV